MAVGVGVLLVVLVVGVIALAAQSGEMDAGKVESDIRNGIREQSGLRVTVECPDGVKAEAGRTFRCTVTDETGAVVIATVEIQNDDGAFVWQV